MATVPILTTLEDFPVAAPADWSALPSPRPLLLVGHGSRDGEGRDRLLEFAAAYQARDQSRPVIPCFLELTEPTIQDGVDRCVAAGYHEIRCCRCCSSRPATINLMSPTS